MRRPWDDGTSDRLGKKTFEVGRKNEDQSIVPTKEKKLLLLPPLLLKQVPHHPGRPVGARAQHIHPDGWRGGREGDRWRSSRPARRRLCYDSEDIRVGRLVAKFQVSAPLGYGREQLFYRFCIERDFHWRCARREKSSSRSRTLPLFPPSPTRVVKHGALKGIRLAEATPDRTLRRG